MLIPNVNRTVKNDRLNDTLIDCLRRKTYTVIMRLKLYLRINMTMLLKLKNGRRKIIYVKHSRDTENIFKRYS